MMGAATETIAEVLQVAPLPAVVEKGLRELVVVVAPLGLRFGRLVVGLLVEGRSVQGLGAMVGGLERVLAGVGGPKHI